MLPSLFISHGSPQLSLMNNSTSTFLRNLSSLFDEPKYILVISAHWVTKELKILADENPTIIYDFFGFPEELYNVKYPIKNDLLQVNKIIKLLKNKNIDIIKDEKREGYDHGVWSPLSLMYPKADIPVIQISLPAHLCIEELLILGEALQELKDDTLIITSGAMTHNIKESVWQNENAKNDQQSEDFRNWIVNKLENKELTELKDFISKAPNVKENHPTLEHFLPLFISLGSSKNKAGKSLHNIYMYGNQSMDTIIFQE